MNRWLQKFTYCITLAVYIFSLNCRNHRKLKIELSIFFLSFEFKEELNSQMSAFKAEAYRSASSFNTTGFDFNTKRLLSKVGSPSLTPEDEKTLSQTQNEMGRIYGSYQVCWTRLFLFDYSLSCMLGTGFDGEFIWHEIWIISSLNEKRDLKRL